MSSDIHRYYEVLEIDPAASDEDIRGAFRRRAKDLHPDSLSGNANAFILLKRAYDTLIDPERRAAYDRACEPEPQPPLPPWVASPEQRRAPPPRQTPFTAPPVRFKSSRRGGVGIVRYVIAFIIMAAISLGGVQAMISWTKGPPSIQTRSTAPGVESGTAATSVPEPSTAPGSSKSGFWDATPPETAKKAR